MAGLNCISQNHLPGVFPEPEQDYCERREGRKRSSSCFVLRSVGQVRYFVAHTRRLGFTSQVWGQLPMDPPSGSWPAGPGVWSHDEEYHLHLQGSHIIKVRGSESQHGFESVSLWVLVCSHGFRLVLLCPTSHLSALQDCLPCRFQILASDAKIQPYRDGLIDHN